MDSALRRPRADDAVYLAAPNSPQARAKVTGRVLDYNGRDLLLDTGGNQKRYPAEQVVGVDSEWTPTQLAADELFARREYAEALVKYEEAVPQRAASLGAAQAGRADDLVPAQYWNSIVARANCFWHWGVTIRRCSIFSPFRCAGCRLKHRPTWKRKAASGWPETARGRAAGARVSLISSAIGRGC